jgi:SAM-dependent methyltransferase
VTSISEQYRELYAGYYVNPDGGLATKRALAAADSLQHMRQLLAGYNPDSIIDVGAGNGSVLEALQHSDLGNRLTALEISASGIAEIKARQLPKLVDVQLFNGYQIPYGDGAFDLAIAIHVLEHVEHERALLRELQRVAKRIIVEVPLENGLRAKRAIRAGRPNGHINYYTPETFINLLETSGLRVLDHKVHTSSLAYEQFLSGRFKGRVKNAIRRTALAMAPTVAPLMATYLLTAYCETNAFASPAL